MNATVGDVFVGDKNIVGFDNYLFIYFVRLRRSSTQDMLDIILYDLVTNAEISARTQKPQYNQS